MQSQVKNVKFYPRDKIILSLAHAHRWRNHTSQLPNNNSCFVQFIHLRNLTFF